MRLLRRVLEFHVCSINKSAYTKKSPQTYLMILVRNEVETLYFLKLVNRSLSTCFVFLFFHFSFLHSCGCSDLLLINITVTFTFYKVIPTIVLQGSPFLFGRILLLYRKCSQHIPSFSEKRVQLCNPCL